MSNSNLPQWKCHKVVRAAPMNRTDYNKLRGWEVPADENPADAGYLVEYIDGGPANHPDYQGYISWSPAAVFESGYTRLPDGLDGLQPHQQRMVIEEAELSASLDRLTAFIDGDKIYTLHEDEISDLIDQQFAMRRHLFALRRRIARFKVTTA